uniref:Uncharacterized protein n=1 Tax=Romanomermis culicivorax TaxID=13658 RepID=A0A915I570_ROMCU
KWSWFSLPSEREAFQALKSRLARVPHRLSEEYVRILSISPFICKYMSPLFTFNKIKWDEAQLGIVCPLEFQPPLQRMCLNTEIFADRTFLISNPYLKTPGLKQIHGLTFQYYVFQYLFGLTQFVEKDVWKP